MKRRLYFILFALFLAPLRANAGELPGNASAFLSGKEFLREEASALPQSAALFLGANKSGNEPSGKTSILYKPANPYDFLLVPTQVRKFGNDFFIVDCYHNQVITSTNLAEPARNWKVIANGMDGPHAIAWDGELYAIVDTENNRLLTYKKVGGGAGFERIQIISHIGSRPHYVEYDSKTGCFMVWSSMTGEMFYYARVPGTMQLTAVAGWKVPELEGHYVRSFSMDEANIYLPCADAAGIWVVDRETFEVKEIYTVPLDVAGIVQIQPINGKCYISVLTDVYFDQSHATLIRAASLEDLRDGNYEDLKSTFCKKGGTLYYFAFFDGAWYSTVPREGKAAGVTRFRVTQEHKIEDYKEFEYNW
ncbi:MAG: hypothetical protein IJU50_00100 [Lachnospiraceae bacterium]|nr:hypothetical protein [Lachnospiraceae bacterium]